MKKLNKLKFKFIMAGLACVLSLVCCPKLAFAMENENEIVAGSLQENPVVESDDNLAKNLENLKAPTNVVKNDSTEASGKLMDTENSITESALKPENLIVEAGEKKEVEEKPKDEEKEGEFSINLGSSNDSKDLGNDAGEPEEKENKNESKLVQYYLEKHFKLLDLLLKKSVCNFDLNFNELEDSNLNSFFVYENMIGNKTCVTFHHIISQYLYDKVLKGGKTYVEISSCEDEKDSEAKEKIIALDGEFPLIDTEVSSLFNKFAKNYFDNCCENLVKVGISFNRFMSQFAKKSDFLKRFPKVLEFSLESEFFERLKETDRKDYKIKFYKKNSRGEKLFCHLPFTGNKLDVDGKFAKIENFLKRRDLYYEQGLEFKFLSKLVLDEHRSYRFEELINRDLSGLDDIFKLVDELKPGIELNVNQFFSYLNIDDIKCKLTEKEISEINKTIENEKSKIIDEILQGIFNLMELSCYRKWTSDELMQHLTSLVEKKNVDIAVKIRSLQDTLKKKYKKYN